jgi:hypothetical protein
MCHSEDGVAGSFFSPMNGAKGGLTIRTFRPLIDTVFSGALRRVLPNPVAQDQALNAKRQIGRVSSTILPEPLAWGKMQPLAAQELGPEVALLAMAGIPMKQASDLLACDPEALRKVH